MKALVSIGTYQRTVVGVANETVASRILVVDGEQGSRWTPPLPSFMISWTHNLLFMAHFMIYYELFTLSTFFLKDTD